MSDEVDVLFLRLEGPFQSWGDNAHWSLRDTRLEPTKSGLTGLIACCLGWGLDQDKQIAELGSAFQLGIRVDRPGTPIRDFHTVEGGVMSAEGRVKRNASSKEPETVVSTRDYLADARFLAALAASPPTLALIESALSRPVWPFFLGRKSCVPSTPIYPALPGRPSRGSYPSLFDALVSFPRLDRNDHVSSKRVVIEFDSPGATVPLNAVWQRRRDVPLSFRYRQFAYRDVAEGQANLKDESEVA
ncbi:MAG TPA: type I-E CRISPR-associated protein Cas5/CasD [Chloroflexota bacterium]|nr:type I-E CRISPR-associated protein Cas5/CasD [Chloroflexota bacterium]